MKLLVEMPLESAPEGVIFSAAEEPIRLSPFGEWSLVTWRHGICWEWCVCNEENRKVLEHPTIFTSCIKAGDGSWRDFTLEFDVRQLLPLGDTSMDEMFNTCGRAGVFFRYVSYRQTYALFLECQNRIVLYRRDDDKWISLASHEIEIDRDRYYQFKVECKGDNIHCWMDGEPLFDVTDSALPRGRVALYANTVARFGFCRVTTDNAGVAEIANYVSSERLAAAKSAEGLCKPKLWKRISHPPRLPGGGKLALDISPGGKLCGAVLITTDHRFAPRDGAALVAVDVEGNVLWSCEVLKDAHVRVWNIDGDGEQDVLLFDGPKIKLLDIHSGGIKLERPAPPCNEMGNRGGRENETPYMPAYKVYPANIRGLGPGRDIVVLDIHTAFWVLNDKLELLWWRSREHGHDLGVCDIDGDGLDEILCGYVMFDHDGRELWTAEGTEYLVFTHDHVDHIIIDEFDGNLENGMEIAITAGNSG
ncbi:MAG: hypothetical protein Q7N50_08685, partial [Armatimonadota bacterium]|nr:hypothetical protein [Armatimonadota bacterium]